MPRTRTLTGIAALSAATLASVAASAPVAADGHLVDCKLCLPGAPGQEIKLIKWDAQYAFVKVESLLGKVESPGLAEAYLKLGLKIE